MANKKQNVIEVNNPGPQWSFGMIILRILLLPLYMLALMQRIKCWIFRRDKRKLYVNFAIAGRIPLEGWVTADQAETARFEAAKSAAEVIRKQAKERINTLVYGNTHLRLKVTELTETNEALRKVMFSSSEN